MAAHNGKRSIGSISFNNFLFGDSYTRALEGAQVASQAADRAEQSTRGAEQRARIRDIDIEKGYREFGLIDRV